MASGVREEPQPKTVYQMKAKLKSIAALLLIALFVAATTGCRNTAKGVGKDIENAGEKIQEKTR